MMDIYQFLSRTSTKLRAYRHEHGKSGVVDYDWRSPELMDLDIPHYWREEADSKEEWIIRYARGLGLHCSYDFLKDRFTFRFTKSVDDEQTITWPGKHVPPTPPL